MKRRMNGMGMPEVTYNEELKKYISLVDFIAEVLGGNSEVLLHDISQLDHSIVAIRNSHISGRKVGGPATDLVLQILKNGDFRDQDFIANYKSHSKNNSAFRSSTYFIRNNRSEIIGMICINTDLKHFHNLNDSVRRIMDDYYFPVMQPNAGGSLTENLSSSIEDLTLKSIENIIAAKQLPPERMTQDEKIEIVNELNRRGVFLLRGAVSEVAKHLKASEATIYRYLQKIK